MIKVQVEIDRMGHLIGTPIREDIRKKIISHLDEFGVSCKDGSFLIERDDDIEDFEEEMSAESRRWLDRGFTVVVLMDPWNMAHYYGWDTHTLFE